jgi:SAM-dependent methyltransferase
MHCAPGTHEAALALLGHAGAPRQGVLDLGAGTGAFLARLRDNLYTDLEAVDLNPARFQLDGVHCASLDLNAEFAGQYSRRFDLVTALEIIEHLDSPRAFLRQVHSLLTSEGILLLSTPNVAHWAGRRKFLLTGDLRMFEAGLYHRMRHISPVTETQMRLMLAEVGFAVVGSATAGEFRGPLKRLLTAPIALAFRLASGARALGDSCLYLARKTAPDRRSPGSTSSYSAQSGRAGG